MKICCQVYLTFDIIKAQVPLTMGVTWDTDVLVSEDDKCREGVMLPYCPEQQEDRRHFRCMGVVFFQPQSESYVTVTSLL